MRAALFFVLIAGISAGLEFSMNASTCESLPVEIRFINANASVCEYYLGSPAGSSFYLGYDYKCGNLTLPWQNLTAFGSAWEGVWNATVAHSGNTSSKTFSIVKALGNANVSIFNRSGSAPAFLPGDDIEVVANWSERCDDKRPHTFSIGLGGNVTEVYYGNIGAKNVSYRKKVPAPLAGGQYTMQLLHSVGGSSEAIGSADVSILSSRIDFSGIELGGESDITVRFANAADQAVVRDINIRLKGGFKEVSKSVLTPYVIPSGGGSVVTSAPSEFIAIGLMPGAAYTAELYGVIDDPERDYIIQRNFSGTFGGFCGDEICTGECSSCPKDCSLAECRSDGACTKALGENCENSQSDCRCSGTDGCVSGACVPPSEKLFFVTVMSGDAPVKNALVESQGGSCITDDFGICGLYANQMDVLKATKAGYLEQTALAAEGVKMSMAKEGSKIVDASKPAAQEPSAPGGQAQDGGIDAVGLAKKAAPIALALALAAALLNVLLKKRKPAAQGAANAVPG